MPIYEFKCLKCNDIFELLLINKSQPLKLQCPKCDSDKLERVLSATGYTIGSGSGQRTGATSQARTCPGGSCTTYDIPGPGK